MIETCRDIHPRSWYSDARDGDRRVRRLLVVTGPATSVVQPSQRSKDMIYLRDEAEAGPMLARVELRSAATAWRSQLEIRLSGQNAHSDQ